MAAPSENRIFDGFNRTTGQKTEVMTFRVYGTQKALLDNCYTGNSSALVRILLQHYFDGKLPDVAKEFLQHLNS